MPMPCSPSWTPVACRGASGSEDSDSPGEHSGERGGEEESPTMDEIMRSLA